MVAEVRCASTLAKECEGGEAAEDGDEDGCDDNTGAVPLRQGMVGVVQRELGEVWGSARQSQQQGRGAAQVQMQMRMWMWMLADGEVGHTVGADATIHGARLGEMQAARARAETMVVARKTGRMGPGTAAGTWMRSGGRALRGGWR